MAPKMLTECIGKLVTIYTEGGLGGYVATVLAVEDNFIKIEDKRTIRYINTDMITAIQIKKEQIYISFSLKLSEKMLPFPGVLWALTGIFSREAAFEQR